MKPSTVVICLHGYFPDQFFGTAVYARQLALALQRRGHRVVIVVPRFDGSVDEPRPASPEYLDGIEIRRLLRPAIRGLQDTFDDSRLISPLCDIFREARADIVHLAHFLGLGAALFSAAKELGLPVFATLTDFHGFCHRGTLLNSWGLNCAGPDRWRTNCVSCGLRDRAEEQPDSWTLAYLASWFARPTSAVTLPLLTNVLPDQVAQDIRAVRARPGRLLEALSGLRAAIAPTRFLHDTYRRHGLSIPIEILPFGIDGDRDPREPHRAGPLRVGFIGQIGRHKGCHTLIAAARLLPAGELTVTVWGDMSRNPGYAESLRRAAWGLDISFAGSLSLAEIDTALRSVDLLVLPSLWAENAPLTLLQALANHTPCLISDQPGMTEFVQDGVNGHVFPTGKPRALAAILRRLAEDRSHLDRLTRATRYERNSNDMATDALTLYERYGVA